jgi:acyl carrier protein
MTTTISETLYSVLSEVLEFSPDILRSDTRIRSLPNADSMRLLQVILRIENAYGIELPDSTTFNVETVGELEKLIQDLCA